MVEPQAKKYYIWKEVSILLYGYYSHIDVHIAKISRWITSSYHGHPCQARIDYSSSSTNSRWCINDTNIIGPIATVNFPTVLELSDMALMELNLVNDGSGKSSVDSSSCVRLICEKHFECCFYQNTHIKFLILLCSIFLVNMVSAEIQMSVVE